ncbi:hypothetical protein BDP55DRAFT_627023 [Colletotrichum godetiae]|uniref:Uncharacterized protein n=1 Tax=Colletotrichum godetiae TaxID=1209918 RepID=A0AAJ0F3A7_9PEZI|nr:uncharacterized protein BDP55DRAFT_627023 [Colletotrichum godetiae]KAK1691348.1 hypothetical protein BDP55DRAFT_627023 [Colletotrichum godetiae]
MELKGVKLSHIEAGRSIVRWGRRPHGQAFAENKCRGEHMKRDQLGTPHLGSYTHEQGSVRAELSELRLFGGDKGRRDSGNIRIMGGPLSPSTRAVRGWVSAAGPQSCCVVGDFDNGDAGQGPASLGWVWPASCRVAAALPHYRVAKKVTED